MDTWEGVDGLGGTGTGQSSPVLPGHLHVAEDPLHGCLSGGVAGGQGRTFASILTKTHCHQLGNDLRVRLRHSSCSLSTVCPAARFLHLGLRPYQHPLSDERLQLGQQHSWPSPARHPSATCLPPALTSSQNHSFDFQSRLGGAHAVAAGGRATPGPSAAPPPPPAFKCSALDSCSVPYPFPAPRHRWIHKPAAHRPAAVPSLAGPQGSGSPGPGIGGTFQPSAWHGSSGSALGVFTSTRTFIFLGVQSLSTK